MLEKEVVALAEKLAHDPSPQVRRECAIALHGRKSEEVAKVWAELAAQHNGKDRWYLEALGIGARGNWDACLSAYLKKVGEKWDTPAGHNIIWRSRAEVTPEYLQKIIAQESIGRESLPRYFRAFDFQDGPKKDEALIQLAFGNPKGKEERTSYIVAEAVSRLKNFNINKNPKYKKALQRVVEQNKGTEQFVALVTQFNLKDRYPEVLELAQKNPDNQIGVEAITALLAKNQRELISKALEHKKMEVALATIQVLGTSQDGRIQELLLPLVENKKADLSLRRAAVRSLAKVRNGAKQLGNLASRKKLDPQLKEATAAALHQATWRDVKEQANRLFPLPAAKGNQKLPSIAELLRSRGDAKRGLQIFLKAGTCANCHKVNGMGKEVGPDLSEIGNKLSRQAMYESILFPSAAISHNYETYALVLKSGNIVEGVLVSDTAAGVEIKGADAIVRKYKESEIEEKIKKPVSLMPADMAKLMSKQDLVDVVTYLTTLKKSKEAKKTSRLRLDSLDYCRQERMLCVLRLEQSIEVFYPEKRIEKLLP